MKFTGALAYAVFASSASLTVAQTSAQQANVGLEARSDAGFDSVPDVFARAPVRSQRRAPAKKKGKGKANAQQKEKVQPNAVLDLQRAKVAEALKENGQQQKKNKQNKRDDISKLEERQPYVIFEDESSGSN